MMATKTKPKPATKPKPKAESKVTQAARKKLNYNEDVSSETADEVAGVTLDTPWGEPLCTVSDLEQPVPMEQEPKTDIGNGQVVWADLRPKAPVPEQPVPTRPAAQPGDVITFAELTGRR